jgi:glucosamine kinase
MNNTIHEKQDIFIGVDGGASNCRLRLEDASGKLLGYGRSGLASIKWSVTETWSSIMTAFAAAAGEAQVDINDTKYRFHLGCGLAGCEIPEACQEFLAKTPPIFATKCLQSDAYTACLGAHDGQDGAIIIVGTGVVSVQIQNNKSVVIGGWGFPHGDEGSAAWLGLEAIRLTTQWLDGRYDNASPLLTAIFHKFSDDQSQLVTWANKANASAFATIAPLVMQYADEKDSNALKLVKQAAHEIDRIAAVLVKKTHGEQALPCCLLGGLAPFIEKWLSEDLRKRLVSCKHDATVGAILMVKKQCQQL